MQQSTRGKIDRIVEKINPDDLLFLINAVYFKGKWTTQFDKKQTAEYPFYRAAGREKKHPMMSQSGKYRYYETEQFQAVSLPYGTDERLSLYIFLPSQNSNLSAFNKNLNAENWEKFFCAIRDNQTSTVLFMGSIVDPQSN